MVQMWLLMSQRKKKYVVTYHVYIFRHEAIVLDQFCSYSALLENRSNSSHLCGLFFSVYASDIELKIMRRTASLNFSCVNLVGGACKTMHSQY